MHIKVIWHGESFNIGLASKEGKDEFLTVKGCRLKTHDGKEFISFPSQKNEKTGKWWNHVWGSDDFQAAVIEAAKMAQPQEKKDPRDVSDIDSDLPF